VTLSLTLTEYIRAAFSGIWIQTHEPDEAQREIFDLCSREGWTLAVWDCARGLIGSSNGKGDPLFPLSPSPAQAAADITYVVLLHNYHRFLNNPLVVQELINRILAGKGDRSFYVVLSPVVQIPIELEKLFVVIEHELPDRNALTDIARELHDTPEYVPAVDAACGLTRYEAEGAFALSLTRHDRLDPETVWEIKAGMLKKSGLLTLHQGQEKFHDLGGLDALKQFCSRALTQSSAVRPRGVLLLGVPGTGKSAFAKALGNETGRPTLLLDVGALMGSLVGQSEANIRSALRIADAMAPCVLFLDEVEKALAGASSANDSGVSARLFGTLLTWLNDHESDVFVVCTSNDISRLPPEFARAERFDGIFFLDLPSDKERDAIWQMYVEHFRLVDDTLDEDQMPVWRTIRDDNWTGAEIRACCRLAALLGMSLQEAAQHVVPVALTAQDKIAQLREWAEGRCLDASRPGIYHRPESKTHTSGSAGRRTIKRKES